MKRVLKEVKITRISAVDYPCQEGALAAILKGDNFGGMIAEMEKHIKKEDGKFVLYSQDESKKLGTFDTQEAALKREAQIKYFEAQKRSPDGGGHSERIAKISDKIVSAKRRAILHARLDSLQKQVDNLVIGKYDDNEPRDDQGRWTDGGGGGGGETGSAADRAANARRMFGSGSKEYGRSINQATKTPPMQRRQYEVLARSLSQHGDPTLTDRFIGALRGSNEHFNADKFRSWANGKEEGLKARSNSKVGMTRQHFNFIADTIREHAAHDAKGASKAADIFAENIKASHSGFKPERFISRAVGDAKARKRAIQLDIADLKQAALALAA